MLLNGKPFDQLDLSDIQALIDREIPEGKTIDYKRELHLGKTDDKNEFLRDVTSFANAGGGHLIGGVDEAKGVPTAIVGFEVPDVDAFKQQIENILRDNVEPRLYGVQVNPLPFGEGRIVLIVQVPQSWSQPHRVKPTKEFYSRNSAGKYGLDVHELRQAFLLSETQAERIRDFRAKRLGMIVAGETPFPMKPTAKLVLHQIPFGSIGRGVSSYVDLAKLYARRSSLPILDDYSALPKHARHIADGVIVGQQRGQSDGMTSQMACYFRDGTVESTAAEVFVQREDIKLIIPTYEEKVLRAVQRFLEVQQELGVEPPIVILLSLLGIKGYYMRQPSIYDPYPVQRGNNPVSESDLILPEVMLEDYAANAAFAMKPVFDMIWNACDLPRSFNYDDDGNWSPLHE